MESKNTSAYFTRLELENIRSFGERQRLNLLDEEGRPAQWTLILGDNGVGKTTLLQCLVRMRPQFNKEPDINDGPIPNPIEPELVQETDNSVLKGLTRSDTEGVAGISAHMITGTSFNGEEEWKKYQIMTSIRIERSGGNIKDVTSDGTLDGARKFENSPIEPLVLAYGAGRHMGKRNLERWSDVSPTDSLFDVTVELCDAEEMLGQLDYLLLKGRTDSKAQLKSLKELLVEILPALRRTDDIKILGPSLSESKEEDSGVWVNTPSGLTRFTQLSLGYQTVVAWTADIAWRMLKHYPKSENPFLEPAIVIVDEIDLHLHPCWQRTIRKHLITHFPEVQFIVTAHSPLMAQDALETNIAVIQNQDGKAVIKSEPDIVKTWRLDQILTSELFGIESARSVKVAESLRRRIFLAQKKNRTKKEQDELTQLDNLVNDLPVAESREDQSAMDIVRKAAKLLENN